MRFTDVFVARGIVRSIGEEWFRTFYPKVRTSLGYDQSKDERSRNLLSDILSRRTHVLTDSLSEKIKGKSAIMFGAGPSLTNDIAGTTRFIREVNPFIVAADGAADALYDLDIQPSAIVSDLDSCSERNLLRNSRKDGVVFVHAHGDNLSLIEKLVPKLGDGITGTTQVESTINVTNYGGLTDGDRACFILSYFDPKSIILAGMDLGEKEGDFSKSRHSNAANPQRPVKLALGKASLEFLVRRRKNQTKFLNVTKSGQEIFNVPKVSYGTLIRESL